MEEKQSVALECLAHIAYETRPDAVFEHVAKAMKEVLEAQEIFFYVRHDGRWLSLWPQEGARPLPLQGIMHMQARGEAFFQEDGWNGVLALHGVQQAEGAVWAVHMPGMPMRACQSSGPHTVHGGCAEAGGIVPPQPERRAA